MLIYKIDGGDEVIEQDEVERLALLFEECGEVIHTIGKILRHGYESCHPNDYSLETNREKLSAECAHVVFAIELLKQRGDIDPTLFDASLKNKDLSVWRWMRHNDKGAK